MNITTFTEGAKKRVQHKKRILPLSVIKEVASKMDSTTSFPFEKALSKDKISFICELKRASPSAGTISEDFPYLEIAREYEKAGADAISVLTEPEYFKGRDEYLLNVSNAVCLPTVRKDFVVDEYQIYEAKTLGASAVLLICSVLNREHMSQLIEVCDSLNISALVEAHTEHEIKSALRAGARVIGVNNRNLNDFTVDLQNSIILRSLVSKNILFVAESGIKTREDIVILEEAGVNAVLIGETMMRNNDKAKTLQGLRGFVYD